MNELFFTAKDIAFAVYGMELDSQEESKMIDTILKGEKKRLSPEYKKDKKKFAADVRNWLDHFNGLRDSGVDSALIKYEYVYPVNSRGEPEYILDYADLELFFKNLRLKLLYGGGEDFKILKMRTLLNAFGYQRRSSFLLECVNKFMSFYRIKATLRGVPCDVGKVSLDDMLTFRMK